MAVLSFLDLRPAKELGEEDGRRFPRETRGLQVKLAEVEELREDVVALFGVDCGKIEGHQDDDAQPEQHHIFRLPKDHVLALLAVQIENGRFEVFHFVRKVLDDRFVVPGFAHHVYELQQGMELAANLFLLLHETVQVLFDQLHDRRHNVVQHKVQ